MKPIKVDPKKCEHKRGDVCDIEGGRCFNSMTAHCDNYKPKQPSIDPKLCHKCGNYFISLCPDCDKKKSIDPKAFEAFMKELGWWNWDTKEVRKELRGALKVYLKEAK